MTRTPYAFRRKKLSVKMFKYASDNIRNVFDLIINNKLRILRFRNSLEEKGRKDILRLSKEIEKENFYEWNYIFSIQMFYGFGSKNSIIDKMSVISSDITDIISELGGAVLRLSPINQRKITDLSELFMNAVNSNHEYINEIILFYLFKNKEVEKNNFIEQLNIIFKNQYKFVSLENVSLNDIIDNLIKEKYILDDGENYVFPSNIFYNSKFINDEIKSFRELLKYNFRDKEIIQRRITGETLQSVSKTYNKSRERIRQRQDIALQMFGETSECFKYKNILEKYNFSEDDFIYLFNETSDTYNFLKLVCNSGEEELNFENMQSDNMFKLLDVPMEKIDEYKDNSDDKWFDRFVEEYSDRQFSFYNFIDFFNTHNQDNKYIKKESRGIQGRVTRCKCAISSSGSRFRYYDYESKKDFIEILGEIINSLNKGAYSVDKLFRDYPKLMKMLDVRDMYELHNLIKKNIDIFGNEKIFKRVKLTRSPGMLIGINDKYLFVKHEMKKFYGNSIKSFIDHMYKKFGFQKNTFEAYLDDNFKDKIFDRNILDADAELNEEYINKIRNELGEDIYLKTDFEKKVYEYFDDISNELLIKLNYKSVGDVYFNLRNESVSDAVKNWLKKCSLADRPYRHVFSLSNTVKRATDSLQSQNEVFQFMSDTYCTIDYLRSIGIDKTAINQFTDKAYDLSVNYKFLSTKQIISMLDDDKLVNIGCDIVFYDDILTFSGKLGIVKNNLNGTGRIFTSHNYNADDFVYIQLSDLGPSMKIDDFIDELNDKYGIKFNRTFIENHAGYYANEMDKIFTDKDQYYEELWRG